MSDWRVHDPRSVDAWPIAPPSSVIEGCQSFAEKCGIVFGCFDFVVTAAGEWVFLEVNESGQFLFLEKFNPKINVLANFVELLLRLSGRNSIEKMHNLRLANFFQHWQRDHMRITLLFFVALMSSTVWADDSLWERLKTEPNLVVLMRHTHAMGGHPLTWDESGNCRGEFVLTRRGKAHARKIGEVFASHGIKPVVISSPMCRCRETAQLAFVEQSVTDPDLREIASADAERTKAFESKTRSLIASKRGVAPVVFVSHTPNINQLTMELIDDGDLLVGRANEKGEVDVLGKITLRP